MPKIRLGKTAKEHRNGSHGRRFTNREARNVWCNDPNRSQANFPYTACNGKRNRSRWTGKGNTTVIRLFVMQKGW